MVVPHHASTAIVILILLIGGLWQVAGLTLLPCNGAAGSDTAGVGPDYAISDCPAMGTVTIPSPLKTLLIRNTSIVGGVVVENPTDDANITIESSTMTNTDGQHRLYLPAAVDSTPLQRLTFEVRDLTWNLTPTTGSAASIFFQRSFANSTFRFHGISTKNATGTPSDPLVGGMLFATPSTTSLLQSTIDIRNLAITAAHVAALLPFQIDGANDVHLSLRDVVMNLTDVTTMRLLSPYRFVNSNVVLSDVTLCTRGPSSFMATLLYAQQPQGHTAFSVTDCRLDLAIGVAAQVLFDGLTWRRAVELRV